MKYVLLRSIIAFFLVGMANANAPFPYTDIPVGVWYEDAVTVLLKNGYLDASSGLFHPNNDATRAEFMKLIVKMNGGVLSTPPAQQSFDDVSTSDWYYPYMEEAAKEGWVRGEGNCLGTHPCSAHPANSIIRAEAAVLLVRAFNLERSDNTQQFHDVPDNEWFSDAFLTMADHCVFVGDTATGSVRPFDHMNRAEMIVLLHRIDQNLTNGTVCDHFPGEAKGIRDVLWTGANTLEVKFMTGVDDEAMVDISRYSLSEGSGSLTVLSAKRLDEKTVELRVKEQGECGNNYTLSVDAMSIWADERFSDSIDFVGTCVDTTQMIH